MKPLILKFICILTTISISTIKLHAQTPDTSTTQKLLQYIFQPIDKNQIPTGFLEEYGCPMLPMETFNGTLTDSNRIDMHLWRTLYFQLQTSWSKAASNPLPSIITVNTAIKQNVADSLPTPIPILIGQYNTVKSNAFTSNLLSYNSSTRQVSDVANRSQSPYNTQNLFAACANKKQTLTGSESFIIKSNLIWNILPKPLARFKLILPTGRVFKPSLSVRLSAQPIPIQDTKDGPLRLS
jgi:hypothetical protein